MAAGEDILFRNGSAWRPLLKRIEPKIVYRRSNEDKAGNDTTELEQSVSHLNGVSDQITCARTYLWWFCSKKLKIKHLWWFWVASPAVAGSDRNGTERIVSARTPYTVESCCHATTIGPRLRAVAAAARATQAQPGPICTGKTNPRGAGPTHPTSESRVPRMCEGCHAAIKNVTLSSGT